MLTNDCLAGGEATRNNNKGKASIPSSENSQKKNAVIENEKKSIEISRVN
jgi:hypothetical protein